MLRIWGRLSSINVRKVVLCAQVLGVPFERIDAGLSYGVVNTPDYRAKNPNGLVPLLEDGDFTLWESNAIVRYLFAREASPLYPQDLQRRADAERWMDWQQTTLNPAGSPGFKQLIRTPEAQRDPAVIAASVAATEPLFAQLDEHLARQPFMAGDALTMADIPIACEVHRWWGLPLPRPAWPHLERWYAQWLALPASRGVLDLPLS
ncbi:MULTISPECIES: glutathione S-transferase family protein [Hydrogenophaga]|jgi:glutathione S-transferase|uniref:Glutathione S-transferase GstB n=1 Tax=Hydrogenophaga pseudoflava TaxID=47421 RepID=A0A4P6X8T0_HYDPS|nr:MULTISPECIES: glutathione S-transferase [Hydrogenophaga]OPF64650.1 glutathione S-transferase [Hydrogenophaga sp. H7]QBM30241.1 Glutathione S-transferase GstB [Hydrogenophaga pseudoflava]